MRQLKYIDDECFFKELQALKEFKFMPYCVTNDIANLIDEHNVNVYTQEIEDFLDSFELPEINSLVYTDNYIFVFNEPTLSDLFEIMVTSIENGIKKMNDNNSPKLKELYELNEQLQKQLDESEKMNSKLINIISFKNESLESCKIQASNTNKSSKISINSFNLFKQ